MSFLNDGIAATFNGAITLPGTLMRYGSQPMYVNADSSSTHAGGTWLHSNTLYFGTQESLGYNVFERNNTAKIGAGNIFVQAGAAIQFNAVGNVAAGQITEVHSNLTSYGMVRLASNDPLSSFNLRAANGYGPQPILSSGGVGQTYTRATNIGAGVISIGSVYTQAIDLAKIGDGLWYLGSATDNNGLQGSYNAATLGFGLGNAYRLGGGSSTLHIGSDLVNSNVLTDTNFVGVSNRLIIGSPAIQNANVANASGTVMIHTNQNYTGSTLINRSSVLDLRARLSSAAFEVFGTFILSDEGTMVNAGNTANTATTVMLRPGSELRFDNANGGLPAATTTQGRWADNAPMTLDNANLRLTGSLTTDLVENVGALNVVGGAAVLVQRGVQSRYAQLNFASLNQVTNNSVNGTTIAGNNGTLILQSLNAASITSLSQFGTNGQLGSDERISVTGGVTLTNNMAPAWIWNGAKIIQTSGTAINANALGEPAFVTYGPNGFVSAGWTVQANAGANTQAITTATAGPTDRLWLSSSNSAGVTTTLTGNLDVFALRIDSGRTEQSRTVVAATPGSETITIRSGGLIVTGGSTVGVQTGLVFGTSGSPDIGYIHVVNAIRSDNSSVISTTFQVGDGSTNATLGQLTASHIVKDGDGILDLANPQSSFNGNIILNGGTLQLRSFVAAATETNGAGGAGGTIVMNGLSSTLNLRALGTAANTTFTFNNNLAIGENNPLAFVSVDNSTGTLAGIIMSVGNLTFGGIQSTGATPEAREQGQLLQVSLATAANTSAFGVGGTTDLGPAGNIFFRPESANIVLMGKVQGDGTLVRTQSGASTLLLTNIANANSYTGGTLLMGGTMEVRAKSSTASGTAGTTAALDLGGFGTGRVTILGGQLNLRVDGGTASNSVRERLVLSNAFSIRGNTTLDLAAIATAQAAGSPGGGNTSTNKNVRLANVTIGSQILAVAAGANGYNLELGAAAAANAGLFITGTPSINNTMDTVLLGVQDGSNGTNSVGNYILKNAGAGVLWVGDASSTFTGGIVNNVQGAFVRFGDAVAASSSSQGRHRYHPYQQRRRYSN
ncbi:MAG: hypothetical protein QM775_13210 [Pirellulales bacterium]